jgi:hypothetical protein
MNYLHYISIVLDNWQSVVLVVTSVVSAASALDAAIKMPDETTEQNATSKILIVIKNILSILAINRFNATNKH